MAELVSKFENSLLGFLYIFIPLITFWFIIKKIIVPLAHNPTLPLKQGSKLTLGERNAFGILRYFLIAGMSIFIPILIFNKIGTPQLKESVISCNFEKDREDIKVDYESVLQIARESDCTLYGSLITESYICNSRRGEWWIDIKEANPTKGCKRSCVVDVYEKKATVNRQCGI